MNAQTLYLMIFISATSLAMGLVLMVASSHLKGRMSRKWITALVAASVFSVAYWIARCEGAKVLPVVDIGIRGSHFIVLMLALWEVSLPLRVWAKAPKIEGVGLIELLSSGGENMLATMAVQQIAQPAWVRSIDDDGELGPVIASNSEADKRWEITGPPTERGEQSSDDTRELVRLRSGARVMIGDPVKYQFQGARQ